MLRLAEEYEAVRGRAQLDARLQELLPDAGIVAPGDLHTKLLSLYWSDVYTTNYDTLLERALDADRTRFNPRIKPRYQIVVAGDDVPYSKRNGRPRIVKLHGSLRAGTKLIVTEEDYRRYPSLYGPFVNTVQQSMLENVFCLIGFSGDDPNFLLWTGWARDHLGDKAPPIYLITLSPVSEGQRLILEKRKIFPIDIAELGKRDGRTDYGKALGELLSYWQEEPPLRRAKWPYHSPGNELRDMNPTVSQLVEWTVVAQRNRRDYPGWLVAPSDNRERLQNVSSVWRVLATLKKESAAAPNWLKLVILEEVNWIFEATLMRLNIPAAALLTDALVSTNVVEAKLLTGLSEVAATLLPSDDELERIRFRLTVAMLRDSREDNDGKRFREWEAALSRLLAGEMPAELQCMFLHERILFCLEHDAKPAAIDLLNELSIVATRGVDPYWRIRVGALFGEVGVVRRAYDIAKGGLQAIRLAIQFEGETAYLVSREQWSEWLLSALEFAAEDVDSPRRRLAVNPSDDGHWSPEPGLRARIEQEERKPAESVEKDKLERDESSRDNVEHPNFLMDKVRFELDIAEEVLDASAVKIDSTSLSGSEQRPFIRKEAIEAATTYVRLIEHASLPPSIGRISFTTKSLLTCFRILALSSGSTTSMRIFARASGGDARSSAEALELPAISALAKDSAEQIFRQALAAMQSITADTSWEEHSASPLKFLMDVASRVAFRLEPEHAVELCELAIRLFKSKAIRDDYSFHSHYSSFFARAVRLLPTAEFRRLGPQMLSLSSNDVRYLERHSWPDVAQILRPPRKIQPSADWHATVNVALDDFARLSPTEQPTEASECVRRLDWLLGAGLMTAKQKTRLAQLLWRDVAIGDVPKFPTFYEAAFICWPMPHGRGSKDAIFRHWLEHESIDAVEKMTDVMGEQKLSMSGPHEGFLVGLLLTVNKGVNFPWCEDGLLQVIEKLRVWWNDEGKRLVNRAVSDSGRFSTREFVAPRLQMISQVIHRVISDRITLDTVQAHNLDSWFQELWEAGVSIDSPPVWLLFACIRWWPDRIDAVLDLAIHVIDSNQNQYVVARALVAAGTWVKETSLLTPATQRYIQFLIDGLHSCPEHLLEQKLNSITELLEFANKSHFDVHRTSLLVHLCSLLFDLENPQRGEKVPSNPYTLPLIRVAVVRALAALGKYVKECQDDPNWIAAMELARHDSLLLVRREVP